MMPHGTWEALHVWRGRALVEALLTRIHRSGDIDLPRMDQSRLLLGARVAMKLDRNAR